MTKKKTQKKKIKKTNKAPDKDQKFSEGILKFSRRRKRKKLKYHHERNQNLSEE